MNRVQVFILPAALLGSLGVALFAFLTSAQGNAPAAASAAAAGVAVSTQATAPAEPVSPPESICPLSARYPANITRWCGPIVAAAAKHNLEPDLLAALMLEESGGDADAFSRNGAVGLLQVMPNDGPAAEFMCSSGPCFASRPSTAELRDPSFNIEYGSRLLAGLTQKQGSLRDGLLAYGPLGVGYTYADTVLAIQARYRQ